MTNLRTEIKFPKDNFSRMPYNPPTYEVKDVTQGPAFYRQEIKKLIKRFDAAEQLPMTREIIEELKTEREQEERLRQEQLARNKEVFESQHQPQDLFIRAYNTKDPSALNEFFQQQKADALSSILNELTGKERHYSSIFHGNVYHAIQVLRFQIAMKANEQRTSLLTKIKETIGASSH